MSMLSSKYGSELHLLRSLGRHRNDFDKRILAETGADSVTWLDCGFDCRSPHCYDVELRRLDFLEPSSEVHRAWADFWPQGRGIQTWDAVGQLGFGGRSEWLLLEAKANLKEVHSNCGATSVAGRTKIQNAFAEVKRELEADPKADWMSNCYQFANRVAALYFLQKHLIPARLLFLYFCGDTPGPQRECPTNAEGWQETLTDLEHQIGLPPQHALSPRIHKLFVPVRRPA